MAYACHLSCLRFSLIHENMSNIIAHTVIILYEFVIYYHTISPTFSYPTLESAPVVCWHNNIIRQTMDRMLRRVCNISRSRKKYSLSSWNVCYTLPIAKENSLFQNWLHCNIDGTWGTLPMTSGYVLPSKYQITFRWHAFSLLPSWIEYDIFCKDQLDILIY